MKQAEFLRESNIIKLKFYTQDQADWYDILKFVKSLPGREFIPAGKYWKVPAIQDNIKALQNDGWDCTGFPRESEQEPIPWESVQIPEEQFPDLRPYQIDGLKFLEWKKGRALICDQMGLGKTPQALSWLKLHPELRPVLIVVPASIKIQWFREYQKWTGVRFDVEILQGKTPYVLPEKNYIINWDILSAWQPELSKVPFQVIIGDEFQAIGNTSAARTKAFKKLAKRIPHFIGLSGTPIRSRPAQFFNALSMVNPVQFSNEWKFKYRYCDPKSNGFGMVFNGASHIEELHELIRQVMIRRRKADVLKDLPGKIRTVIPLPVEDLKEYQEKVDEIMSGISKPANIQRQLLESLSYSAFGAKKELVCRWIDDFLESGEKLVVFAWHRVVIDFLMSRYGAIAVKIDGGTPKPERDNAIRQFQTDPSTRLFIGNIIAAGVGIDGLQRVCSDAVFVELTFTPTDHAQAEDRLHRFGQEGSVNIYYLIAEGTVEEDMAEILDRKIKVIDALVDGELPPETDMYKELMTRMKNDSFTK